MLAWISEDGGMALDHCRYIKIQHYSGAQRTQTTSKVAYCMFAFPLKSRKLACVADAAYRGLWLFTSKELCNNYQEGEGAEKLELSSKNLDSTPFKTKKN